MHRGKGASGPDPKTGIIVGIGASAGSLDVLGQFFAAMPADSGLAFVLVQHLERHHPSALAELLGKHTPMPVQQVKDGERPKPNHVYVIAPNTVLTLERGILCVAEPQETGLRAPINAFFHSLARDQGENAVGIIVSGAGSDGTAGLRSIKEHDGLTLVQAPETARYDSMPRNAIMAGLADFTLTVEEMPAALLTFAARLREARGSSEKSLDAQVAASLGAICQILQQRTGHDFSRYRQGTLLRRIRRRVNLRPVASAEEYVRYLEQNPAEAELLQRDLLIGVTHFFRDPEAFTTLVEQALPAILKRLSAAEPLRVWVLGCASGEEAYSIAILVREYLSRIGEGHSVQIFATDIDAEMLATARRGHYSDQIREHVSPERLDRFFVREGDSGYRVAQELRDMCTFSEHSLIQDPPFSSLDLLSCRNVLIYLSTELQKKLVPLFHYALRSGGYLLLGPSESLAGNPELFVTVDKKHRLFQRSDAVSRPPLHFPLVTRASGHGAPAAPPHAPDAPASPPMFSHAFDRMVLEEYAPPCAVVNEQGDILYVAGRAGRYLQVAAGVPTQNLFDVSQGSLRAAVRDALSRAARNHRRIVRDDLAIDENGGVEHVRLTVRPLPGVDVSSGLYAVVLQGRGPGVDRTADEEVEADPEQTMVEQLENELRTTRMDLQSALEELASANEELKSANEELLSANEELQSANEELQTSKEELQSANDELNSRVQQLDLVNSQLEHHYAGTKIATVFLDPDLRIISFTPAAHELFNVIEGDVGRPIRDLAPRFVEEDLLEVIDTVLRTKTGVERHVHRNDGASFLVRILPYHTQEGPVGGVGITFVDVSDVMREREAARAAERSLEHMQRLVDATARVVGESARTWDGLLQAVADAARELTAARIVVCGHGQTSGRFVIGGCSRAADAPDCPPVPSFPIEKAGILVDLFNDRDSIRLTDQEMRAHPLWWGLPDGHVPMRGLLGARLSADDGTTDGMILATDREEGDFTPEDEVLLRQLGIIASLATHHVRTRTRLEQADAAKNQFLATLSHELRNPLAPITTSLHILERAVPGGGQFLQAREIIVRQVNQLVRLVDDLLDVTRIARDKIQLQRRRLELNDLVRDTVEDHRPLCESYGLRLELQPASEPVFVDADWSRIAQVVGNLLQNSAKFTPAGGSIRVAVSADPAAARALVRVSDSGIGMETGTLASLFQPFQQADSSLDRSQGGLGLGLALVRGLVHLHEGEVTATSAGLGKGAEVIVRLPLARGDAVPPAVSVDAPPPMSRRVLVIEDSVDAAASLQMLLTLEGHEVAVAHTGADSLALAVQFRPEVALCDIGLPGMDGYEVARAFRSSSLLAGTFLVALTGYGMPEDVQRAMEAGFALHLTKPPSLEQLNRVLASIPDPIPARGASGQASGSDTPPPLSSTD